MLWAVETRFVLPRWIAAGADSAPYETETTYELAPVASAEPFTEAVLSWNADTPPGTCNQHGVRPLSCRKHPIFT